VVLARLSVNERAFDETSGLRSGGPIRMAQGHGQRGTFLAPGSTLAQSSQQRTACLRNSRFLFRPASAPKGRPRARLCNDGLTKWQRRLCPRGSVGLSRKVPFELSELDFVCIAVGVN
jgi:hypothetical protein